MDSEILVDEDTLITGQVENDYRVWKKNVPYLYSYLLTSSLLWPSLTVQWFPDVEFNEANKSYTYRLLSGTFTSSSAHENLKILQVALKKLEKLASVEKYDPDSQEFLSTDSAKAGFKKLLSVQDILHKGEVNKARYMPQNSNLICSINNLGEVYVFDRTKHSSSIRLEKDFKPQISLAHHKQEGFGLSWNVQNEGLLLSCALDGDVALWDVKNYSSSQSLTPVLTFDQAHEAGTNDVKWMIQHDSVFASVGEDRALRIFDTRTHAQTLANSQSQTAINTVSFNHENMFCLATGDNAGRVNIWDLRAIQQPVHTINNAHDGSITVLDWNRRVPKVLATGGQDDCSVKVWDLSQIGAANVTDLKITEKPQELVFVHKGHMLGVNDLSWNPHDDWLLASAANDNSLHIWKPATTITN